MRKERIFCGCLLLLSAAQFYFMHIKNEEFNRTIEELKRKSVGHLALNQIDEEPDGYDDIFDNPNFSSFIDSSKTPINSVVGDEQNYDVGKQTEIEEQDPYMRGYITGYHRAIEQQSCPR